MQADTLETIPLQPIPAGYEFASAAERWPAFDGMPGDARARMERACVAVIGLGSIGRALAEHLARAGIGAIKLVDDGALKPQSILTHSGVFAEDVGESKVRSAGAMVKRINPVTRVEIFSRPIQQLETAALTNVDFIAFATDNLAAEVAIGERAALLGKPLLQMSVHGEALLVHARTWTNRDDGPCPRCLYNAVEEASLRNGQRFSCEGSFRLKRGAEPTRSISALCSLAGAIGATIVLRDLLGLGEPLADEIIELCAYTWETWRAPIRRRGDCPVDHTRWRMVQTLAPLATLSLQSIAAMCGLDSTDEIDFELDSATFAEVAVCDSGHEHPLHRFISSRNNGLRCGSCGSGLAIPRTLSRARVPASMLSGLSERPLGDIAPAPPRWVIVRDGSHTYLVTGGAR